MKKEICEYLSGIMADVPAEELEGFLEIPPEEKLGDFGLPCFMLAKKLRKNPDLIAEDIAGGGRRETGKAIRYELRADGVKGCLWPAGDAMPGGNVINPGKSEFSHFAPDLFAAAKCGSSSL